MPQHLVFTLALFLVSKAGAVRPALATAIAALFLRGAARPANFLRNHVSAGAVQAAATGLAALAFAVMLTACGGSTEALSADASAQRMASAARPALEADDAAAPVLSEALAGHGAAAPCSPPCATREQAGHIDRALGLGALHVVVDCCSAEDADEAVRAALGLHVARGLDLDAPVLVYGFDEQMAASVAKRLAERGLTQVRVVMP